MKKIFIILFLLNLFFAQVQANELTDKMQVRLTLKKYNSALCDHDIKKIKTFFDEEYKSSDGFNLDELTEMFEKTHSAYKNIKYSSKIHAINVYDTWALVQMSDKTSAKIYPTEIKELKKEKMGKLVGKSVSNVYLKKENDAWKIVYDEILMEETALKYGLANKVKMNLVTPMSVKNNEEYDLSLKIEKPKDIIALASISREEVTYPAPDYKEKFRAIPQEGELERIVRANNKNLDEYAVASVGLTRVSMNKEQTKAKIEILGIAYLMKRINMDIIKRNSNTLVKN